MKVNFYFYGDIGTYDKFNPDYVFSKEYVGEIIYLIGSNNPFSIKKEEIMRILNISEDAFDDRINNLKLIQAIEEREESYKVNFSLFLEKDVRNIDKYLQNIGEKIGNQIIGLKALLYNKVSSLKNSDNYSKKRILYHIICDSTFDNYAFDFFVEKDVMNVSKIQPGNRDYIIFAYEDSEFIDKFSNNLLCSSNNYRTERFNFNSFGDSNGYRKDMYRFFRILNRYLEDATPFQNLNMSYIKLLEDFNRNTMDKFGLIMENIINGSRDYNAFSQEEKNIIGFLKEAEYITIDENTSNISAKIPVFYSEDEEIVKEISYIVLSSIYNEVKKFFDNFNANAKDLTPVKHCVDIKEVALELWHQIFGATNEYLVKSGFVEKPREITGEGRYLRSFSINNK